MICPKCGNEMEAGFLQTNAKNNISWVSKMLPMGIGFLKKDAIIVSELNAAGVSAVPTHICKNCKLLVSDYSQLD